MLCLDNVYTTAFASKELCEKLLNFISMYGDEIPAQFLTDLFISQNLEIVFGNNKNGFYEVGILQNNYVLEIPVLLYNSNSDMIIVNEDICKRVSLN